MSKQNSLNKYMDILFSQGDLDELRTIFTDDLQFNGPFFQFSSANAYIDSLKKDPPIGFKFELSDIFEKDNRVAIFYHFSKGAIYTPMAQLFEFDGDLINKITLIFNGADFT